MTDTTLLINENMQDIINNEISSDKRLIVELEFVQNLSNMQYVYYLATNQVYVNIIYHYFILILL
jgi:hypothetical protein